MDAIKKKMQSLKSETDNLIKAISSLEEQAKSADDIAQQCECDIRDISKKITMLESDYDIANDQYNASIIKLDETEKSLKITEEDVNAMTRRQALMETEVMKADTNLADTVTKLALTSKDADSILKKVKHYESKTMRNEVEIEEMDKSVKETKKMADDSETKLDEMSRRLGIQEEECKRSNERAQVAEAKIVELEEELRSVGENMKQLEISAENATIREEKLKENIHGLMTKLKTAEARYEYGEMNITKLHQRIDDIEDDIYREKFKIKKVSDELNETFDDMLSNY